MDQVKFDVMELHGRPELAAQQRMVDDGSGDVKVRKLCLMLIYYKNHKLIDGLIICIKIIFIIEMCVNVHVRVRCGVSRTWRWPK